MFSTTLFAQEQKQDVILHAGALQQGEFLVFGNKSLKFKEVVADSRCPKDVTCIWAGEAKVLIEVLENGKSVEEKVVTIGATSIPLKFNAEDILYSLSFMQLLPYPTSTNKNPGQDYTLNLQVKEKF